jgi:DNA-binding CsgD family transcriptional regulator
LIRLKKEVRLTEDVYLAIIGDVVGSREVENRGALQRHLILAIDRVNKHFHDKLAAGFVLTIGDEFQGLLNQASGIDRLLSDFRAAVHPVELRFGVGFGTLDTPLEMVALGMDGPCFHRARAAIERADARGTPIEVEGETDHPSLHIYSLLYAGLRKGWTTRQRQVFDLAMSGVNGKSIALRLGITPSAVSQHLRAAEAEIIAEATGYWVELLQGFFRGRGSDA